MPHPEPAYFTVKMLSARWNKTEDDIEAYLRGGALRASINIQPNYLLYQVDDICKTPVLQGGVYEIADYKKIEWNNTGNCDFGKQNVGLMKLSGDPSQYKEEWIKSGKLRSLRYMWRLNAYGHEMYMPLSKLIINKRNIFIELAEVQSYEKENGIAPCGAVTTDADQMQLNKRYDDQGVSNYMSVAGKKGGSREKKQIYIIAAVVDYLMENKKMVCKTNEEIAKKFCTLYQEKQDNRKTNTSPKIVNVEGVTYEVYYYDKFIFWRPSEKHSRGKNKNPGKSIAYSTFKNRYISYAKKHLLSSKSS